MSPSWAEIEKSLEADLEKINLVQVNRLLAQKEMEIVVLGPSDKLEDLVTLRS